MLALFPLSPVDIHYFSANRMPLFRFLSRFVRGARATKVLTLRPDLVEKLIRGNFNVTANKGTNRMSSNFAIVNSPRR